MKVEAILWVFILASLALAIVSTQYRQYALLVVGVGVLTVITVILLARKNEVAAPTPSSVTTERPKRVDFDEFHIERLDKEDPEAKSRIEVSELLLDQIRPHSGSEPGTIESIRARLRNPSARFTLTDYAYHLVVQDCVEKMCTTVYDQRGWEATAIPAGQARDVTIEIRSGESRESPPFKLLGEPNIILSPTAARAYGSASTP